MRTDLHNMIKVPQFQFDLSVFSSTCDIGSGFSPHSYVNMQDMNHARGTCVWCQSYVSQRMYEQSTSLLLFPGWWSRCVYACTGRACRHITFTGRQYNKQELGIKIRCENPAWMTSDRWQGLYSRSTSSPCEQLHSEAALGAPKIQSAKWQGWKSWRDRQSSRWTSPVQKCIGDQFTASANRKPFNTCFP